MVNKEQILVIFKLYLDKIDKENIVETIIDLQQILVTFFNVELPNKLRVSQEKSQLLEQQK